MKWARRKNLSAGKIMPKATHSNSDICSKWYFTISGWTVNIHILISYLISYTAFLEHYMSLVTDFASAMQTTV